MWRESVVGKGPSLGGGPGVAPKRPLRLGSAISLAELNGLVFFSPAVLYLYLPLGDQPLLDFMYEQGRQVDVFYAKFRRPIFAGLQTPDGDTDWDHALWAVRSEDWGPLLDFYCSLSVVCHMPPESCRVGMQQLDVPDPIAVVRPGSPKMQRVHFFGLYGDLRSIYLSRRSGPLSRPSLTFGKPDEGVAAFRARFLAGGDPLQDDPSASYLGEVQDARRKASAELAVEPVRGGQGEAPQADG